MNEIYEFVIIKELMEEDDPDTEVTTLYLDQGDGWKRILEGDYYHDKIDSKIEGFFEGLEFSGVNYEVEEIGWEQ